MFIAAHSEGAAVVGAAVVGAAVVGPAVVGGAGDPPHAEGAAKKFC